MGAPTTSTNAPCDKAAAAFFSDVNVIRRHGCRGAPWIPHSGSSGHPALPTAPRWRFVFSPQHVKIDFDRGGRGPNPTPKDGTPGARRGGSGRGFMGHESLVRVSGWDFGRRVSVKWRPCRRCFLPKPGTPLWPDRSGATAFVFRRKSAEARPRAPPFWGLGTAARTAYLCQFREPAAIRRPCRTGRRGVRERPMLNNIGPAGLLLLAVVVLVPCSARGKIAA